MSENIIVFDGVKHWEYKDSPRRGLFHDRRGRGLHRAIWEAANGPIPPGHHIHHVNGDRYNNGLDNLECVSASDHARLHYEEDPDGVIRRMVDGARASGYVHHRTPEGHAWHVRGAKVQFSAKPIKTFHCIECGKPFERRCIQSVVSYCGGTCRMRYWRRQKRLKLSSVDIH